MTKKIKLKTKKIAKQKERKQVAKLESKEEKGKYYENLGKSD